MVLTKLTCLSGPLLFCTAVSKTQCLLSRAISMVRTPGLGNPYETSIRRKREVRDPSYPKFDEVECLKWADWRMLRDVKRRHINSQYWQSRINLKNLSHTRSLPNVIQDIAREEREALPRYSSICLLKNRCSITSRARGKLLHWRLSRIVWRDMADHGLISGAIRAKWG